MKTKKKIIFILLIAILITLGYLIIGSYEEGLDNLHQDTNEEPKPFPELSEEIRQNFVRAVESRISELSPIEPVLGGHWQISRIWFGSDLEAYVEYDDGHIMRRIILLAKDIEISDIEVIAYFESGQDDWELISGQDILFGKNLDLYEYDDKAGTWTKKN